MDGYWTERTSECLIPLCGLKLLLCQRSPEFLRRCRLSNFEWLFKLMVPFRLREVSRALPFPPS